MMKYNKILSKIYESHFIDWSDSEKNDLSNIKKKFGNILSNQLNIIKDGMVVIKDIENFSNKHDEFESLNYIQDAYDNLVAYSEDLNQFVEEILSDTAFESNDRLINMTYDIKQLNWEISILFKKLKNVLNDYEESIKKINSIFNKFLDVYMILSKKFELSG